jgi:hypothetical protein
MEQPLMKDPNKPLSLTLGRFDFVPDPDDAVDKLQEEVRELKSKIALLEEQQSQTPWWKRFFGAP